MFIVHACRSGARLSAQETQLRLLRTSACSSMPLREHPAGRHLMQTHPAFSDVEEQRPALGAWPNYHPGTEMPSQCKAPEPTYEMKHTKNILTPDFNDATEIAEFDRVHAPNKQFQGNAMGFSDTGQ